MAKKIVAQPEPKNNLPAAEGETYEELQVRIAELYEKSEQLLLQRAVCLEMIRRLRAKVGLLRNGAE
jgi:hypothetical protein